VWTGRGTNYGLNYACKSIDQGGGRTGTRTRLVASNIMAHKKIEGWVMGEDGVNGRGQHIIAKRKRTESKNRSRRTSITMGTHRESWVTACNKLAECVCVLI
jgi:hypothetical protein